MPHFVKRKRGEVGRREGKKEASQEGRRSLVHTRGQGQIERRCRDSTTACGERETAEVAQELLKDSTDS